VTAEFISAFASVGTLVVIVATAVAAFAQLRHMSTTNSVMIIGAFREEYERVQAAASDALPGILERLKDARARRELLGSGTPAWLQPLFPLMRLMETLGNYTGRKIVPHELVCDQWAPVILGWWIDCAPIIAVMRRRGGLALFEHWEAIAVLSKRWLDEDRQTYPKRLPRFGLVDPWDAEDRAVPAGETAHAPS
jgi:hypothetical protein